MGRKNTLLMEPISMSRLYFYISLKPKIESVNYIFLESLFFTDYECKSLSCEILDNFSPQALLCTTPQGVSLDPRFWWNLRLFAKYN